MKSKFWKGYFIYLLVILVALLGLRFYVRGVMVEYENQDPAAYVRQLLQDASDKDGEIGEFLKVHAFEGPAGNLPGTRARFYEAVDALKAGNTDAFEFAEDPAHIGSADPIVNVTKDGKPFLRVQLHETEKESKLVIMTISRWEIASAVLPDPDRDASAGLPLGEDGLLSYTITVPEGFTLLLNGDPVDAGTSYSETPLSAFDYVAPYTEVPTGRGYEFSGMAAELRVSALNNAGEEVAATQLAPGAYEVPADFAETQDAMDAMAQVADPLYIGELWSQFMTDDVGGSYHGLYTVRRECMLLEGSNLYELATNWAGSIDITFVSTHVITSWDNESVRNFIRYNDRLLSADVYFEKVMRVGGSTRTDVFDNRMYFVYIEDPQIAAPGWYLADMLSLEGTHE